MEFLTLKSKMEEWSFCKRLLGLFVSAKKGDYASKIYSTALAKIVFATFFKSLWLRSLVKQCGLIITFICLKENSGSSYVRSPFSSLFLFHCVSGEAGNKATPGGTKGDL